MLWSNMSRKPSAGNSWFQKLHLPLIFLVGVMVASVVSFHPIGLSVVFIAIGLLTLSWQVLLREPIWDSRGSQLYTRSVLFWPTLRTYLLITLIASAAAAIRALFGKDPITAAEMTIVLIVAMPIGLLFAYSGIALHAGEPYSLMSIHLQWIAIASCLFFVNVIIVIFVYVFRHQLLQLARTVIQSPLFSQHHFFINILVSILMVGIGIVFAIRRERISWELLERFQGISIFSPIYCLGGGAFGKKTLSSLNIPTQEGNLLIGSFIVCGVLFLLFLLTFALFREKEAIDENRQPGHPSEGIVDQFGTPIATKEVDSVRQSDLSPTLYFVSFIASLAIALLFATVLDFSYLVLTRL